MTIETARSLITTYGEAWVERDADKILTIFTPDATYFDPRETLASGHEGIKAYWEMKVLNSQRDIHFTLLNLWIDGDTVLAEWNAKFVDTVRSLNIDMTEVAIFTVRDEKFSSLREYYWSNKTPITA
jgi:uncharacterized protein (TIGR02246 family)